LKKDEEENIMLDGQVNQLKYLMCKGQKNEE